MSLIASPWSGVFFILASVAAALLAHTLYFRRYGLRRRHDNEYAGILFGAGSLVYSILIAFVIVAVWEDYEDLNQTINKEAGKINDIALHDNALPAATRQALDASLVAYCQQELREWNEPSDVKSYRSTAVYNLRMIALEAAPENSLQQKVVDLVNDDLDDISQLRHDRMDHVRSHVPTLVWLMVVISSLAVVLFSFLIHTESFKLRQIGVSFLTFLMAMSLYLIFMLDHPFTGSFPVSKAPLERALYQIQHP